VGSGAGTWEFWWSRIGTLDDFVRNSHSLYFDVLPELGVIGVALLLLLMGFPLRVAYRRYRRSGEDPDARATIAALAAVAVVFTLSTIVDWTWKLPAVGAVYFVALGLLVGPALAPEGDGAATVAERRRKPAYGTGILLVGFAWLALIASAVPMLAERKVRESQQHVRDRQPDKAVAAADTAVRLAPWAAEPKVQSALVHQLALQPTPALERASEATVTEPANWRNWLVLADIQAWANQPANADQSLRRALALNPRSLTLRQRVDALPSSKPPQ
jgi:hypothetical protein